MPKERSINPAQAARKADKAKALKKSKAEKQTRNNEKLARRNPERLQRQIDELKELEDSGALRPKDKQTLEQLEKDVRAVNRARETLGDRAPEFSKGRRDNNNEGEERGANLGKRRRDERDSYGRGAGGGGRGGRERDHESDTDDEVRDIPMPRDTPPPIPRRDNRIRQQQQHQRDQQQQQQQDADTTLPPKPVVQSKTVYSSAPVLRDLAQESRRFVPVAVAQNMARKKGEGGKLLEPEELERLEKAGYGQSDAKSDAKRDIEGIAEEAVKEASFNMMNVEAQEAEAKVVGFDVDEEARRFERELRHVEMEEVSDEDL